jgi:proteic killer suppression protein
LFRKAENFRTSGQCKKRLLDLSYYPCYHIFMIQAFKDVGTDDIFNGVNSRKARKKCPSSLWNVAVRKLDLLDSATDLQDLKVPPGNQLEALSGYRRGQYSIRVNDQYRICFKWTELGPDDVEIVDYH